MILLSYWRGVVYFSLAYLQIQWNVRCHKVTPIYELEKLTVQVQDNQDFKLLFVRNGFCLVALVSYVFMVKNFPLSIVTLLFNTQPIWICIINKLFYK